MAEEKKDNVTAFPGGEATRRPSEEATNKQPDTPSTTEELVQGYRKAFAILDEQEAKLRYSLAGIQVERAGLNRQAMAEGLM